MKNRILMVLMLAVALVTLTVGCDKKEENNNNNNNNNNQQQIEDKKLVCSKSEKEDKYTEEFKFTYNYKGDAYDKVTVQSTTKYNSGKYDESTYKKYSDECKKALEDTKKAGFTCNTQASGSSIWVTYQFTIADLNDASKKLAKDTGIDEVSGKKLDEAKTIYEAAGFTCQEK